MEGINSIIPSVKVNDLALKANEILSKLQQAGLFRAIVIERQGNQVLLDTAYGKLTGKAPDNLNKGDEILARLVAAKSDPTIKIEQHSAKVLTLKSNDLKALFQNNSTAPVVARVLSHSGRTTQLQIANNLHNIPRQNSLQPGEYLLLTPAKNQQIELQRIQPESILKQALKTLLPQNMQNSQVDNLSSLQKFASEILQLKPQHLLNRLAQNSLHGAGKPAPISNKNNPSALAVATKGALDQSRLTDTGLKQLLTSLASPLARLESFKPDTVQQILTLLSLVKSSSTGASIPSGRTLPETLSALIRELKNTPESFRDLVRQVIEQPQGSNKNLIIERSFQDITSQLRNELIQQADQSLNQLLTQKTALRLQTEQHQPIQLNLNIPLQVHDESRNLKLKIKQKPKSETQFDQHWEINLAFEFGLLGMISTHILLQNQKLSAHFWATSKATKILIDHNLEQFKTQLTKSGFELGLFDSFHGQPPEDNSSDQPQLSENLLDIKV